MTVDSTGLTIPTVLETVALIATDQKNDIDPTIVVEAEEFLGQLNGIFASRPREAYELLQVAYNGFNPDDVEGYLQDALCRITGTFRLKPKASVAKTVELDLDANVTIPTGAFISIDGHPDIRFQMLGPDIVGTTAGVYTADFTCDELGPVVANANTLTVIATPITGWNSVTNPEDAVLGNDEETTSALRVRREEELFRPGSSSLDGIRADVLALEGVIAVRVFENVTDTTDSTGLPSGYIEVLVYDGIVPAVSNDVIAQAIFDTKAAGTKTYGNTSGTAIDATGASHTIKFSRPTVKELYLEYELETNDDYPGEATFKAQIKELGLPYLNMGDDVIYYRFTQLATQVTGVVNIVDLNMGFSASPSSSADLAVGVREIAEIDTSRITVVV